MGERGCLIKGRGMVEHGKGWLRSRKEILYSSEGERGCLRKVMGMVEQGKGMVEKQKGDTV